MYPILSQAAAQQYPSYSFGSRCCSSHAFHPGYSPQQITAVLAAVTLAIVISCCVTTEQDTEQDEMEEHISFPSGDIRS
jgi:hypothetical protein